MTHAQHKCERDYAAQLERTLLAWNRMALAVIANGILIAREGFPRNLIVVITASLVIIAGALIWAVSSMRYAVANQPTFPTTDCQRLLLAVSGLTIVVSIADVILTRWR